MTQTAQNFKEYITLPALTLGESHLAAITRHPSSINPEHMQVSDEEKIVKIAIHFKQIMEILGLDLTDPSLAKTPERVAKMYVKELFCGLNLHAFPAMSVVKDANELEHSSRLILLKVGFTSFCEHHFVPMIGQAYLAYVPDGRLLGFSKFSRIVRYFARRPQLQERLTAQVADSLAILLQTENIAVLTQATHYCVIARGVEDESGQAVSQVLRGDFRSDVQLQKQFLAHIRNK
jgi:GTP cyclohydrolase I